MWIGIDFGTCYSSAALVVENYPKSVKFGHNITSIPSSVFLKNDGSLVVGYTAENNMKLAPDCYKREFKRDLGAKIPCYLGGKSFSAERLISEILLRLKTGAEEQYTNGREFDGCLLTVPADYKDHRSDLMKDAAINAGFNAVELLSEPVAAASYFMWQTNNKVNWSEDDILLVYDFGGGTFDSVLIQKKNFNFELLSQPVSRPIGGVDFDRVVFRQLIETLPDLKKKLKNDDLSGRRMRLMLVDTCRKIKHRLSEEESVEEMIILGEDTHQFVFERTLFESLIEGMIDESIAACEELLAESGLKGNALKGILLVGGSTRIPYVKQAIVNKFRCEVFHVDDPELAVSYGAALHANRIKEEGSAPSLFALSEYKTAVTIAWSDGELNPAEIRTLNKLESSLGLRARDAEIIEKEIMGIGRGELSEKEALKVFKKARYKEALPLFLHAAKIGYPNAQYYLGRMYESGLGVGVDKTTAENWYLKASIQGSASAQFSLGDLYFEQGHENQKMLQKAIEYYEMAATQGDPDAQNNLGQMYHEGIGVKKSLGKAEKWYLKAAKLEHVVAAYNLGLLYKEKGTSSQYHKKAMDWFRKAAEQKDPDAQFELGFIYERGLGIKQNYKEAHNWYEMAANQGNVDAMRQLAELYKHGYGVKRSRTEAREWLNKARLMGED